MSLHRSACLPGKPSPDPQVPEPVFSSLGLFKRLGSLRFQAHFVLISTEVNASTFRLHCLLGIKPLGPG